ncbi:ankyrin [Coprinopsis marcescibilis]|uniref:Ankyrin n=1 Tax=Coprinopsis marcescibilis TaxID=230819 RepID=A0A5C3KAD2_COPMA|nr:ankyrin [Coprinopsis marcescibilis]
MMGNEDVVAFLMGVEGVDVNLKDRGGQTALFAAAANHHAGVVKAILSGGGVKVNEATEGIYGSTPLTHASHTGQHDIVQLLLEAEGIDVNRTKGINFRGPLDEALNEGRIDNIETILNSGEVSLDKESAFNSLMCAAHSAKSEAVIFALNHRKFDVNGKDDEGHSALAHSLRSPRPSTGAAEALLQIPGIDINSVDKCGTTILMLALRHETDAPKLVETIIKLGRTLDINAKDGDGQTALAHAVSKRSWEVVLMLLGIEGVDYNCVDALGRTPLMMAVKRIEGVDYNCVDALGRTPLMMAVKSGHDDIVALLLEFNGIKIDARDNEGKTALAHAISNHQVKVFEALLKVDSISAEYTTSEGMSFVMLAAESGNATRIRSVLQLAQFDINARDTIHGRTALAFAVASRSYDAVEALLEVEGVDVHCVDKQGMTLLMHTVMTGKAEMVNRCLGFGLGANINATDVKGRTALFHAAKSYLDRGPGIVSTLLKVKGIDLSVQDAKGRTPLMVAIEKERKKTALLLRKAGGHVSRVIV